MQIELPLYYQSGHNESSPSPSEEAVGANVFSRGFAYLGGLSSTASLINFGFACHQCSNDFTYCNQVQTPLAIASVVCAVATGSFTAIALCINFSLGYRARDCQRLESGAFSTLTNYFWGASVIGLPIACMIRRCHNS